MDGLDKPIENLALVEDEKYFWRGEFVFLKVRTFAMKFGIERR